ncbi:hypothetical protein HZ326_14985 [Fusarium oxysporum f. sp. albedinis]|nr:hypothetical protein HZ326_14985 [Fusarium oxysporum f. sp. albedinis]
MQEQISSRCLANPLIQLLQNSLLPASRLDKSAPMKSNHPLSASTVLSSEAAANITRSCSSGKLILIHPGNNRHKQ